MSANKIKTTKSTPLFIRCYLSSRVFIRGTHVAVTTGILDLFSQAINNTTINVTSLFINGVHLATIKKVFGSFFQAINNFISSPWLLRIKKVSDNLKNTPQFIFYFIIFISGNWHHMHKKIIFSSARDSQKIFFLEQPPPIFYFFGSSWYAK